MSELQIPIERPFDRKSYHRRGTIQFPPDGEPLIRIEVVWDERDKRAVRLADDALKSLEMLALKRILDDDTPIVVRKPRFK